MLFSWNADLWNPYLPPISLSGDLPEYTVFSIKGFPEKYLGQKYTFFKDFSTSACKKPLGYGVAQFLLNEFN